MYSLEKDIQKLIYFAQAILDRNAYYVEDYRQEALTILRQLALGLNVPYLESNLLLLYRVFSEEKPETWVHPTGRAKPKPIWSVSNDTEKLLAEFISVSEVVIHKLRKGRE